MILSTRGEAEVDNTSYALKTLIQHVLHTTFYVTKHFYKKKIALVQKNYMEILFCTVSYTLSNVIVIYATSCEKWLFLSLDVNLSNERSEFDKHIVWQKQPFSQRVAYNVLCHWVAKFTFSCIIYKKHS